MVEAWKDMPTEYPPFYMHTSLTTGRTSLVKGAEQLSVVAAALYAPFQV